MVTSPNKWSYFAVLLVAGVLVAAGVPVQSAETKTLEGTISDTMCGAKHNMGITSAAECTVKCVETGSKYALVVGDKVYELNGKADDLKKLAGTKAKITGSVDGNKVQVTAVSKI